MKEDRLGAAINPKQKDKIEILTGEMGKCKLHSLVRFGPSEYLMWTNLKLIQVSISP